MLIAIRLLICLISQESKKMIKSYSGYRVPLFVVMLKHAGYVESDSFDIERGQFFRPVPFQLIVNERNENDTPFLFSDTYNMNQCMITGDSRSSRSYFDMLLNLVHDPILDPDSTADSNEVKQINTQSISDFVHTYGKN